MSRSIFFDLDGTLTDSKPGITRCIQHALESMGRPVPSADALEWCIGPPLLENFRKLVGEAEAPRGVELYRERYVEVGIFENEVYSGIVEALDSARDRGGVLYVASSKPKVFVDRILERFELEGFFEASFGSELDGTRTDKAELLAFALDRTGVSADEAVMVGDRGQDAVGAARNSMRFLGVLYGYGAADEFMDAGFSHWVEAPGELPEAIFAPEHLVTRG